MAVWLRALDYNSVTPGSIPSLVTSGVVLDSLDHACTYPTVGRKVLFNSCYWNVETLVRTESVSLWEKGKGNVFARLNVHAKGLKVFNFSPKKERVGAHIRFFLLLLLF